MIKNIKVEIFFLSSVQAVLIQLKIRRGTMKRISNIVFKLSALFLSVEFNYSKYEKEEERKAKRKARSKHI